MCVGGGEGEGERWNQRAPPSNQRKMNSCNYRRSDGTANEDRTRCSVRTSSHFKGGIGDAQSVDTEAAELRHVKGGKS